MLFLIFLVGPTEIDLGRYDIFDVSSACVSPEGVLAIMDNDPKQLVLFSEFGDLIGRFGRSGEGPQEFGYVPEMFWQASLQAFGCFSETQNRISYWKEDGTFIKVELVPRFQWTESIHALGDGSMVFLSDKFGYAKKSPKIHRLNGTDHQVILELSMEHPYLGTAQTEMGPFGMVNDFHPRLLMDVGSRFLLYCNTQSETISILSTDFKPVFQFKPQLRVYEITPEYLKNWLKTHENFVQDMVKIKNIERPKTFPSIHHLMFDDEDRIWVFGQKSPESELHEVQVFQRDQMLWSGSLSGIPFQIQKGKMGFITEGENSTKVVFSKVPF